jgi:hypothetical protein
MKSKVLTAFGFAAATALAAAGEFINLGFDEPDLSRMYQHPQGGLALPPEDVLRGWSFSFDWTTPPPPPEIAFFGYGGGAPFGLVGSPPGLGTLSLFVNQWYGAAWFNVLRPTMHLYQVGRIPSEAVRLWVDVNQQWPTRPIHTFVDSQELPDIDFRGLYDVSAYAGQEVKLEFVFPGDREISNYWFDIHGFVPVPEPCTWALLLLGAAPLFRRVGKRRWHR